MKVLLLQDVRKIGKKGQIVEVNDGYAGNFILPRNLGRTATSGDEKNAEILTAKREESLNKKAEKYNTILDNIKDTNLTISTKANEKGGLFSALKKERILQAIHDEKGINVPEELLEYSNEIKETGEHKVYFVFEKRKVPVNLNVVTEH